METRHFESPSGATPGAIYSAVARESRFGFDLSVARFHLPENAI
jgi:hypothetical protein